jgi:adenosylhomocysteine nucleosidase
MNVDYILNVGVAGSISKDINKCDIVIADKLVQHDYDARPLGFKRAEIPDIGIYIDCDKKLLDIAKTIDVDTKTTVGVIASGDIFVTEQEMGVKINEKYNALCVEMEGAAIAQVCHLCSIPFIVIRAISDSPYEEDNHITFEEFLKISANMAAKFIKQFLDRMD